MLTPEHKTITVHFKRQRYIKAINIGRVFTNHKCQPRYNSSYCQLKFKLIFVAQVSKYLESVVGWIMYWFSKWKVLGSSLGVNADFRIQRHPTDASQITRNSRPLVPLVVTFHVFFTNAFFKTIFYWQLLNLLNICTSDNYF